MLTARKNGLADIVRRIREQPIIWHFCTPKSASTFFMKHLRQATASDPRVGILRCLPSHKNRPQVVCPYTIADSLSGWSPTHVMLAPHTHALATDDLLNLISDNHLVVLQMRALFDTVVSIADHLDRNPVSPFIANSRIIWSKLEPAEKLDFIIQLYVPWHVQFVNGWNHAAQALRVVWIDYEDAVRQTNDLATAIFSFHGIACDALEGLPKGDIRLNVGRPGRGLERLSPEQQERIAGIVRFMGKPWAIRSAA
jgi:hypothetical protein